MRKLQQNAPAGQAGREPPHPGDTLMPKKQNKSDEIDLSKLSLDELKQLARELSSEAAIAVGHDMRVRMGATEPLSKPTFNGLSVLQALRRLD